MLDLNELSKACFRNSRSHGFWDGDQNIAEKLCLIHSEVSEALEEVRMGNHVRDMTFQPDTQGLDTEQAQLHIPKPVGFPSEMADIIIRVMDLCGAYDIDIQGAVEQKMTYNASRPHKHGKEF